MKFDILWDPNARKQLSKLPKDVIKRIITKVKLAGEIGRFMEVLTEHEYGHKIRVGDYRILVDIYYNPNKIIVRAVGHRRNIYKYK